MSTRPRGSSRIVYWAHEMVGEETTKLSLRTITVKTYLVRLTPDEQTQLSQMIRSGKAAARTLLPARILLKADTDSAAPAWSDEAISEALEVHARHGGARAPALCRGRTGHRLAAPAQ